MRALVAYDIANNRVRNRALKRCRAETGRYQLSAFELDQPRVASIALLHSLNELVETGDDIACLTLAEGAQPVYLGRQALHTDTDGLLWFDENASGEQDEHFGD